MRIIWSVNVNTCGKLLKKFAVSEKEIAQTFSCWKLHFTNDESGNDVLESRIFHLNWKRKISWTRLERELQVFTLWTSFPSQLNFIKELTTKRNFSLCIFAFKADSDMKNHGEPCLSVCSALFFVLSRSTMKV